MTAEGSPNRNSEKSNSAQERQHFVHDGPNTELEYDPDYVPDREFVLMPLFRRIGEMLGIRRQGEDREHIYAPELTAPQMRAPELEHLSASAARTTEDHEDAPSAATSAEAEVSEPPIEHRIEPEIETREQTESRMVAEAQEPGSEPLLAASEVQPQLEPMIMHEEEEVEPEPEIVAHAAEESFVAPVIASGANRTPPPAAPVVQPLAAREARPQQAAPARPVLTQEDIAQLVAPITEAAREAAVKISSAISQAAEWLHTKEEEIRRRAELAAESKQADISQASATDAPNWESDQAPGLQREAAWHETGGIPVARNKEAYRAERKAAVLKPNRPALWKRIDWAQEFTPKRVAVLGGVAMAMLIVVGVSLARRPASSVLPQQTHVIQPAGVTLTTHPRATTVPATVPAARQVNPAPQRQAVAPTHSSKRAAYNDGPDVVTHYYGKPKPSPARQSSVTGVKHYSDMESR